MRPHGSVIVPAAHHRRLRDLDGGRAAPGLLPTGCPMNTPDRRGGSSRTTRFAIGGVIAASLLVATVDARAAWVQLAQLLSLQGKPEPASANVLSEHHLETLDGMTPQAQAEFLLERSINHYAGANREIETRLPSWRGKLQPGERFEAL